MKKSSLVLIGALLSLGVVTLNAKNQRQCEDACYNKAGQMQYTTQSGATSKALDKCLDACAQLGSAQKAYKKCIANAHTQADKEACRQSYRDNRPDI